MKVRIFVALLMASLIYPGFPIRADDDNSVQGEATGQGRSGKISRKFHKGDGSGKNAKMIRGHCTILEGPGNPITTPCSNTVLILNDEKGAELFRTRTTSKGDFEFSAEETGKYRIGSGSKFYDLVSPTRLLRGGESVEVNLREN